MQRGGGGGGVRNWNLHSVVLDYRASVTPILSTEMGFILFSAAQKKIPVDTVIIQKTTLGD